MPKPKPTHPKKCVSLNLSEVELAIVDTLAIEQYRGNQSAAARQIFQEWNWWKGHIAANQGKQIANAPAGAGARQKGKQHEQQR